MTAVKCVVWDLDGTVRPGVAIESGADAVPAPEPRALRAMDVLEERGIVSAVASRSDPGLVAAVRADPDLSRRFVSVHIGWGHKSETIARIADELGISVPAIAFVDDSAFERAEVAAMLPQVQVFTPEELYERLDTPAFRPEVVTADARRRADSYREEHRRREAARDFAGPREEFLRSCEIRLGISRARISDLDRVAELVARTHQLNSTGEPWSTDQLRMVMGDPGWLVVVARLTDTFGDYGLIGVALLDCGQDPQPAWRLRLLAVSCRVAGREVPLGLLRWLMERARAGGAERLLVDLRTTSANLPLRILLRRAGFALTGQEDPAGTAGTLVLTRSTTESLPEVPWLTVTQEPALTDDPVEHGIRELLATVAKMDAESAARLPATTPLLFEPVGLSSVGGAELLMLVRRRFGVDVAAEDLGLTSLESLASLVAFVRTRC